MYKPRGYWNTVRYYDWFTVQVQRPNGNVQRDLIYIDLN